MKILENILSNVKCRPTLIREFQEKIWNEEDYGNNENINEILRELAYDLDFYEPDKEWRKESLSYYGDKRLEQEVKVALEKIEKHKPLTALNRRFPKSV